MKNMKNRSQRNWIVAGALGWGAFGVVIAVMIYTNPQTVELSQKELTQWLVTPVVIFVASVITGGIFGFELYDWRERRRRK